MAKMKFTLSLEGDPSIPGVFYAAALERLFKALASTKAGGNLRIDPASVKVTPGRERKSDKGPNDG